MSQVPQFASFDDAYLYLARLLSTSGTEVPGVIDATSPGSNFGTSTRSTRELIAGQFCLLNPRARTLNPRIRKTNAAFAIANVIWTLRGSSDIEMISFYNPKGKRFSRDGMEVEAAFGDRLFTPPSQVAELERRLRVDPTTRRAFAAIYDRTDSFVDRLDVPCAIGLQFFQRSGALHCVAMMRSQSALFVLPYDTYLFTVLHEHLAGRLGLALGSYYNYSASLHFYSDEEAVMNSVLEAPMTEATPVLAMDRFDDNCLAAVFDAEASIRCETVPSRLTSLVLDRAQLGHFWSRSLEVLREYCLSRFTAE